MTQRMSSETEFLQTLSQNLSRYSSLYRIAPKNWLVTSGTTLKKFTEYNSRRKDHFRLNLPYILWSLTQNSDSKGRVICHKILDRFNKFILNNQSTPGAVSKVAEIFDGDWHPSASKMISILSELCFIEYLSYNKSVKLLEFDSPLSNGKCPKNADIKVLWDGAEVFIDVKSPTITDNISPEKFRAKFEEFSLKDFQSKFSTHKTCGVYRVLAYLYKASDDVGRFFYKGGGHLKPITIQHFNGEPGAAMIFWIKPVTQGEQFVDFYVLNWEYGDDDLIAHLSGTT